MTRSILISRTYSEVTPESAEEGEFSDNGFISEKERVTFDELVRLMSEHPFPSASHDVGKNVWYSTDMYTSDYGMGTCRQESIHYHRDNKETAEKLWIKAAETVGLVRKKSHSTSKNPS